MKTPFPWFLVRVFVVSLPFDALLVFGAWLITFLHPTWVQWVLMVPFALGVCLLLYYAVVWLAPWIDAGNR